MDIARVARTRYSTKAYDPTRKLAPELVEQLLEVLRNSPSSVNSQPWRFIVAETEGGKARIARSTAGASAYNAPKLLNAALVVAICVRTALDDAHLAAVLEQEAADGRFPSEEAKAGVDKTRRGYVALHRDVLGDTAQWMEKQAYLALGALLLAAGTLEVDATPIEGFDSAALDAELGLAEQGLRSVVLVALGYRAEDDFNARLPKSRLPAEQVIVRL